MRRITPYALAALVLAAANGHPLLAPRADAAPAPTPRQVWATPAAPFRVIGNVYYVGTRGISSWLIDAGPSGAILLDGGVPEAAPLVEANIVRLGFRLRDVKILLNSHAHYDHSGALAQLKRDTGAVLIASAGDKPELESGKYLGSEERHDFDSVPVKVDRVVADGGEVRLGAVVLTARLTPGHTRGCTTWTLGVVDHGAPHQALFFCSASVAANHLAPREQYPGIVADYRRTFAVLKTMTADVFLAPHAEQFDLWAKRARMDAGPNPFIVPGEFRAFAAHAEADFETELARQQGRGR